MNHVPPPDVEPDRVVAVQLFADAGGMCRHRKSILEWVGKHDVYNETHPLYIIFFRQEKLNMVYMGCISISILRGTEMTQGMFLTLETHPVRGNIESCSISGVTVVDEACAKAWVDVHVVSASDATDDHVNEGGEQTLWEALARVQSHPESASLSWMAASMIVKGATFESRKTAMKKWILSTTHQYHGKILPRAIEMGTSLKVRLDEDTPTPVPWGRMAVAWSYPTVTVIPTSPEEVEALRVAEWMRVWNALPWRSMILEWCEMIQTLPGDVISAYRQALHHLVYPWVTEKVMRHIDVKDVKWIDAAATWTLSELSANPLWNVALDACRLTAAPVQSRGDPTAGMSLERIVDELQVTEEEASEIWSLPMQTYPDFLAPWIEAVMVRGELKHEARLVWSTIIVYVSQSRASMDVDSETPLQEYLQLMFASWIVYVGSHSPGHTLTKERVSKMADLVKGKLKRCIEHENHLTPGMSQLKTQCGSPDNFWRSMYHWSRS